MQPFYKGTGTTPIQSFNTKPHPEVDKNKKKKRRRLKLLGMMMVAFLIWAGSFWMEQKEILQTKKAELDAVKVKIQEVNEEQAELSYQIKRLHDKDYIAEVARRDYFLSKPGEMIFKVPQN
jgi:cell division protein DivIC